MSKKLKKYHYADHIFDYVYSNMSQTAEAVYSTLCEILRPYVGLVLTGDVFNKITAGYRFVKLFNFKKQHRGVNYEKGFIYDPIAFSPHGECREGGLYFVHESQMSKWVVYNSQIGAMYWYAYVTIPGQAADVYIESLSKCKTDMLDIGDIKGLLDDDTIMRNVKWNLSTLGNWVISMHNDEVALFKQVCMKYPHRLCEMVKMHHANTRDFVTFCIMLNLYHTSRYYYDELLVFFGYMVHAKHPTYSWINELPSSGGKYNTDTLHSTTVIGISINELIAFDRFELIEDVIPDRFNTFEMWCWCAKNYCKSVKYLPQKYWDDHRVEIIVDVVVTACNEKIWYAPTLEQLCEHMRSNCPGELYQLIHNASERKKLTD